MRRAFVAEKFDIALGAKVCDAPLAELRFFAPLMKVAFACATGPTVLTLLTGDERTQLTRGHLHTPAAWLPKSAQADLARLRRTVGAEY